MLAFLFVFSLAVIYIIMGTSSSSSRSSSARPSSVDNNNNVSNNDYELVITSCKQLDLLIIPLATRPIDHVNPGLHERISAAELPPMLERQVRYLATVRNSLVHDIRVTKLDDREGFVNAFVSARSQLTARNAPVVPQSSPSRRGGGGKGGCIIA